MMYGLQEVITGIEELLGKRQLPFVRYQDDGDWTPHLPKYENQTTKQGQETSGCTVWGWQNSFEIFEKGVYGVEPNYSERFSYIMAGIKPQSGKDPNITFKAIQEYGLIDNDLLPMTKTIEEFLDTTDVTGSLLAKGQHWLFLNELLGTELWNHRNRPQNYKQVLKENLERCPVPVSVSAWEVRDGVYVSDQGSVNNHFCVAIAVEDYNGLKDCIKIFDSYDHSIKYLHPDHNIRRAFAFWINKKKKPFARRHISVLQAIINTLMNKRTLLEVCESYLGKDASPRDDAPDELACVDTVTRILQQVRPGTPHLVSTIKLNAYLSNPAGGYVKVDTPQPEDVIVSPTSGKTIGHAGIFMEDDIIASNNSFGLKKGTFTKNFTHATWVKYYRDKLGLPVNIYRKV
jgi:hypothetical protein